MAASLCKLPMDIIEERYGHEPDDDVWKLWGAGAGTRVETSVGAGTKAGAGARAGAITTVWAGAGGEDVINGAFPFPLFGHMVDESESPWSGTGGGPNDDKDESELPAGAAGGAGGIHQVLEPSPPLLALPTRPRRPPMAGAIAPVGGATRGETGSGGSLDRGAFCASSDGGSGKIF